MAEINPVIQERARKAVELVSGMAKVRAAYFFGSQVSGKTHEFSDVDLGVFIEGLESWDFNQRVNAAALVQERLGDDLELHFFPAEALVQADPASFAAYILRHGVNLDEAEKPVKP